MRSDNGLQAEAFIQLADQSQAGVGGDAGSLKRDLQKPVECELKGLGFFLTHRVPPSVARFPASEPRKEGSTPVLQGRVPRPNRKSGLRVSQLEIPAQIVIPTNGSIATAAGSRFGIQDRAELLASCPTRLRKSSKSVPAKSSSVVRFAKQTFMFLL